MINYMSCMLMLVTKVFINGQFGSEKPFWHSDSIRFLLSLVQVQR